MEEKWDMLVGGAARVGDAARVMRESAERWVRSKLVNYPLLARMTI